jgi:predicted ThiF/HesA family dinucleotide-utilizing enzyme
MRKVPNKILVPAIKPGQTFKVIGLGGVGGIVARYLSVFLRDYPCRLVMIDGDDFEPNNARRMLFNNIGNKAHVIANDLIANAGDSSVSLLAIPEYVSKKNIKKLIQTGDIVIMAVDNHTTRKLVNDYCAKLKNMVLISGGNDGMEEDRNGKVHRGTYGNVQVYIRVNGHDRSPSLVKFHPEIADPKDKHPGDLSCGELVVGTPQILFTNMQVACSMLHTVLLYTSDELHYSEVAFDVADAVMQPIPIPAPRL